MEKWLKQKKTAQRTFGKYKGGQYRGMLYLNEDGTIKGTMVSPNGLERVKVQYLPGRGGYDQNNNLMGLLRKEDGTYETPFEQSGSNSWRGGWDWADLSFEYITILVRPGRKDRDGRTVYAEFRTRLTP